MKKNPLLAKIEAKHELELKITRDVTRQEMVDCAMIALNKAYGFGPERNKKFLDVLNETINEVADLVQSDTPDKEYSIAKFEELVKQVCGDRYSPREVRYGYDL